MSVVSNDIQSSALKKKVTVKPIETRAVRLPNKSASSKVEEKPATAISVIHFCCTARVLRKQSTKLRQRAVLGKSLCVTFNVWNVEILLFHSFSFSYIL